LERYAPACGDVLRPGRFGAIDTAFASIDEVLADTERDGQRWFEAETHRIRGDILFKRGPANATAAEGGFLTAIDIAQRQEARSFDLRAALSLVRLYQSTGRAADVHAVLAPAFEGFSPNPEFPEIAQAQALLAEIVQRI
jgi:predicted ATPase